MTELFKTKHEASEFVERLKTFIATTVKDYVFKNAETNEDGRYDEYKLDADLFRLHVLDELMKFFDSEGIDIDNAGCISCLLFKPYNAVFGLEGYSVSCKHGTDWLKKQDGKYDSIHCVDGLYTDEQSPCFAHDYVDSFTALTAFRELMAKHILTPLLDRESKGLWWDVADLCRVGGENVDLVEVADEVCVSSFFLEPTLYTLSWKLKESVLTGQSDRVLTAYHFTDDGKAKMPELILDNYIMLAEAVASIEKDGKNG